MFASGKVGNGACHFQNAVVGPGRQGELLHRHAQEVDAFFVWFGKLVNHSLCHLRIAVDAFEFLESGCLNFPCLDDAFANFGTRFTWSGG